MLKEEIKEEIKKSPLEEAFYVQLRLEELRREEKMLKDDLDALMAGCISRNEIENEDFKIVEKITTKWPIDSKKFVNLYPKKFKEVATVTLKAAKRVLSENELEQLRYPVETISRSIVSKRLTEVAER